MSTPTPNPYAAPQFAIEPIKVPQGLPLASRWARFGNWFIDQIVVQILSFMSGIVLVVVFIVANGGEPPAEDNPQLNILSFIVGVLTAFAYYAVLEATTGRTIGKFITGTKVVRADGSDPSFGQILGRSLCRFIPFEPFSFFGSEPIGWHDSIPGTKVVKTR